MRSVSFDYDYSSKTSGTSKSVSMKSNTKDIFDL